MRPVVDFGVFIYPNSLRECYDRTMYQDFHLFRFVVLIKTGSLFYLQTSFLSLVPNKLFDLTTPTTSQYMPAVNSSVRNAKSSIDFLEDMDNEILMLNQSKCHTPMVFISKKASPYPLMEVSCLQP